MISSVKTVSTGRCDDPDIIFDHKIIAMPNKCTFPSHSHDMCELLYFVGGEASYYIEGRVYPLKSGDLVFIRSGKHHMLVVNGGEDYERYVTMFSASLIPESLYEKTDNSIEVVNFSDNLLIKELFSKADQYYRSENTEAAEYQAFLRAMVVPVFCEFVRCTKKRGEEDEPSRTSHSSNETLHQVLMHINKNIRKIKTIDEVCESLYLTKRYLHYLFKNNLGTTPKKYITEKRLFAARLEIRSGKTLTEAYQVSGFTDYTSFYRNYKAYFGHAPSFDQSKK